MCITHVHFEAFVKIKQIEMIKNNNEALNVKRSSNNNENNT